MHSHFSEEVSITLIRYLLKTNFTTLLQPIIIIFLIINCTNIYIGINLFY